MPDNHLDQTLGEFLPNSRREDATAIWALFVDEGDLVSMLGRRVVPYDMPKQRVGAADLPLVAHLVSAHVAGMIEQVDGACIAGAEHPLLTKRVRHACLGPDFPALSQSLRPYERSILGERAEIAS